MFKKIILLSLLFLCSCGSNKEVSCILEKEDRSINLNIKSINDNITSIDERIVFILPNSLMANEEWLNKLIDQLDGEYHFEDNNLVREATLQINNKYSLNKTIEYLRKERFFCE